MAQTPQLLDQPTGLTATAVSPSQINLAWIAGNSGGLPITGYEIEYKTASGDYTVLVANTANNVTSYSSTGLSPNTTYTYRVSAISSRGLDLSNEATATTLATIPNPPTGLTATAVSPTQINLAWAPPSNDGGSPITGYKIEYKIDRGSYSLLTHTSNPLTYFSTDLTPSTSYTYRISTDNAMGTSTTSNEASAITQAIAEPASNSAPPIQQIPSQSASTSDQPTNTQTQSSFANMFSNPSITKISGTYSDPENGIQIAFPEGWNGNKMQSANLTAIMLTKNATQFFPSITFEIMDKYTLEKMVATLQSLAKNLSSNATYMQAMMKLGNGCNTTPPTLITVNGMNAMQMIVRCTSSGESFASEMTIFETNKNFVSLLLATTDFEKDSVDYNSALNSIEISNTVQVSFADLTPTTPTPPSSDQSTTPAPSSDQSTTPAPSSDQSTTPATSSDQPSPLDQLTTPSSSPQPSPHIIFTVSTDKPSYSSGDTVTSTILFSGTNEVQNIAVDVKDQTGSIITSKTVTTDSNGVASLQFDLPTTARSGSYQIVATSSYHGNSWGNSGSFDLQQNGSPSPIGSAHVTEQQGNSPLSSNGLGFLGGITKFFNGLFHF